MKIWAWGANTNGQCGLGYSSEQISSPTEVPVRFGSPENPCLARALTDYPDARPVKIVVGSTDTLVLLQNVPFDEPLDVTPNFQILPYPTVARDIAAGWDFSLYLSNNGTLHSRGNNSHCQLGRILPVGFRRDKAWGNNNSTGDLEDDSVGVELEQVAAGLRHGVVISANLELLVWGNNSQNQIGPSNQLRPDEQSPASKRVESPRQAIVLDFPAGFHSTGFTHVACGKDFTVACDQEGNLFGCGLNKYGQLCHAPQDVKGFQGFASIFERIPNRFFPGNLSVLACGWTHCLALLDTGKVISWGRNDLGQLGRDSINPKFDVEPNPVPLPEPIVSIACGSEHNLALGESGSVYAWGWNEHESCGVPNDVTEQASSNECIRHPVKVPFPDEVKMQVIGAGAGTSFAMSA